MGTTGGIAVIVGIWYQTIGGAIALVDRFPIKGTVPNINYENTGTVRDQRPKLLLEGFGMDALILLPGEVEFIQFKVSTQIPLPQFSRTDVWNILRNATEAILMRQREHNEKIVGFIVASNRPIGKCFKYLRQAVKKLKVDVNKPETLREFEESSAPSFLFPKPNKAKSKTKPTPTDRQAAKIMRDFALSITQGKAKLWGATPDECVSACLKAIASFAFAEAQTDRLEKALHEWLRT